MPFFAASFSIEQDKGGAIVIKDTSDFTLEPKTSFSSRQLVVYKHDGSVITIPFTFSAYPLDNISIFLERDYCLKIEMRLISNLPQYTSSYTAYRIKSFNRYFQDFAVNIAQSASLSSRFLRGDNFYAAMCDMFINDEGAKYAEVAQNQLEAQACLNRNYFVMTQQIVL